jgi:hypothetical protein
MFRSEGSGVSSRTRVSIGSRTRVSICDLRLDHARFFGVLSSGLAGLWRPAAYCPAGRALTGGMVVVAGGVPLVGAAVRAGGGAVGPEGGSAAGVVEEVAWGSPPQAARRPKAHAMADRRNTERAGLMVVLQEQKRGAPAALPSRKQAYCFFITFLPLGALPDAQ